ncbi:MAG: hypoxanthine phosphoribosyltransferase [Clostridiales bacterium]|nr:hypoxanthine phosphoribosyltransferase [Clostridiales bacterium]
MNRGKELYKDLSRILITHEEIQHEIQSLADQLNQEYKGKELMCVCILRGAVVFFTDLIRLLDLPLTIDFMAISSYGGTTKSSGEVRMQKDLEQSVMDKHVLVVEDIVDSGLTLAYIMDILSKRGAKSVKLATLLDKPEGRKNDLKVDYACFTIPNEFVVGYGLDYDEKYRNLPDIGILDPKIYM